jgi:predicted permease
LFGTAVEAPAVTGGRATASRRTAVTNALVVSQVALSVVVLLGAGLFLRTLRNLQNVELGFQQEQLTVFRVAAPPAADTARRTAIYHEVARRLQEQPGVTGASFSLFGMLSNNYRTQRVSVPGYVPSADESMSIRFSHVERSFFDVTGIRIVDGRAFDTGDEASGRRVAIIDRAMATRYFGGRALGQRFALLGPSGPEEDSLEVIGVAADAKYRNVREEPLPTVYTLVGDRGAVIVPALVEVRTSPAVELGERAIRRVVREVEPAAVVTNVATMTQVVDAAMAQERLLSTVASLFGALALVVAAIGLYGVRSFAIASRTKEIGIRVALGATRMGILRSLLGQGVALVSAGVGLGTGAALLLTRPIEGFLYQVQPNDPATFAGVAAVLGSSTLIASYLPARRATRIDPVTALRSE